MREHWSAFEDEGISLANRVWEALQGYWAFIEGRPRVLRWGIVAVSVTISLLVGISFRQNATLASQLLFLLPAVLISGLYGGMYAGIAATGIGALGAIIFKWPHAHASIAPDAVGLILYAAACALVLTLARVQQMQQEQIRQFAGTLENRVKERTGELETANRELLDLCYSISHDLRAPMRNIVGSSRILLEEAGDQLSADSKAALDGIVYSANKLASWVDDLLRYAKLGHAELKPEWVSVTQIVDDLALQMKNAGWDYSSVTLSVQPNLIATGDRILVGMALRSLLENSYKYAKKGKPLLIEIGEQVMKDGAYITVRDNGIGFEQQYAEKIFEPFERLHRETEYPGSGIGLANVKRIVERHGGNIFAQGVPMVGAAFYVRFGSGKTEGRAIYSDSN